VRTTSVGRRQTSLASLDLFQYSLQTKLVASSFNFGDVWNGVSTRVANCTVHQCAAGSLTFNMNEVRADPVNT